MLKVIYKLRVSLLVFLRYLLKMFKRRRGSCDGVWVCRIIDERVRDVFLNDFYGDI